jgi:predicted phosphohydrolase
MALYALGDPHLSLSSQKPMDVFGGAERKPEPEMEKPVQARYP